VVRRICIGRMDCVSEGIISIEWLLRCGVSTVNDAKQNLLHLSSLLAVFMSSGLWNTASADALFSDNFSRDFLDGLNYATLPG
jgi:hypothetical protein